MLKSKKGARGSSDWAEEASRQHRQHNEMMIDKSMHDLPASGRSATITVEVRKILHQERCIACFFTH